jgi:hypothetical protein
VYVNSSGDNRTTTIKTAPRKQKLPHPQHFQRHNQHEPPGLPKSCTKFSRILGAAQSKGGT